jgi:hypothetical protein
MLSSQRAPEIRERLRKRNLRPIKTRTGLLFDPKALPTRIPLGRLPLPPKGASTTVEFIMPSHGQLARLWSGPGPRLRFHWHIHVEPALLDLPTLSSQRLSAHPTNPQLAKNKTDCSAPSSSALASVPKMSVSVCRFVAPSTIRVWPARRACRKMAWSAASATRTTVRIVAP